MELNDLINHTSEWLKGTGPNSEIIISSRIRLARNLAKHPFSHRAKKPGQEEVLRSVEAGLADCHALKAALFLKLADLDEVDKQFLIERHLMSRDHALGDDHKGLAISDREIISVMINEEDHLRMQALQSGFNLRQAWQILDALDDELAAKVEYAFSNEWGYLTACPTNTGTGLRASVMAHLPALVMTKQINKVLQAIAKLGLTARGFYGEGTEAVGNFFQISNQVALGHSEDELIENLERIIRQVIEHEQNARDAMSRQDRMRLSDRIGRAFGTLQSAYIISSNETVDLLSSVRLGVDMDIVKDIDRSAVNELFILIQPAHLQKLEGKKLSSAERDVKRATLIRSKLIGNSHP
ncbi:MAG: protein arginine kinase [Candidatus Omnitrophica bacterium]|nr:protein arginine kinase [Candidatus Omnitrophota bacterium]